MAVRGMMYYREALELQAFLDMAKHEDLMEGYKAIELNTEDSKENRSLKAQCEAVADMKFTYVVSCQQYGIQKRSGSERAQDILRLMTKYPSLRVAYIDEIEQRSEDRSKKLNGKVNYFSVLVRAVPKSIDSSEQNLDQEIYRIKLPGPAILGEGKPENQNHAIIFTRGEGLQTIDMNQDNYMEEALKMRNLLQEFLKKHDGVRYPTILGLREHIFTGSVSSLAWFMSNQETSFVTIGQRLLANPLKVRFHYGHPDVFDRLFHLTRGGVSKASKVINLSEDIFAGFNSTLREGNVTHHEYIQVGKGRDVGLNQISMFEAKIANGNGEQTLSRDIYRLGHRFDFFRMLSCYFTTVGFYFSTLVTVLTVYVFLYGRLYLVLSGLEQGLSREPAIRDNKPLQVALASQSFVQIGFLMALPMLMEIGLERGFRTALSEFILMQLQLAPVFFTFSLGTKTHYYGRTLLHGGAKYRPTGRGFVVFHAKFAENYRLYSRSHFVKGIEMMILLIVYQIFGHTYRSTVAYVLITASLWFMVGTWLFAPFLFNPSGFEWQKIVDDWTDWNKWINNRGGIGVPSEKSWESWWEEEQEHLQYSGKRGIIAEILLALRFFIYQYGLVYHLHVTRETKSFLVYGASWLVIVLILFVMKTVSVGRRRFSASYQLVFRLIKGLIFLTFVSILVILVTLAHMTIQDIIVCIFIFMPTGWGMLLIAQALRPVVKKAGFWGSVRTLARGYEIVMGLLLFTPVAFLAWFPFVSEFQTRMLFNQAFSRGLQIYFASGQNKKKKFPFCQKQRACQESSKISTMAVETSSATPSPVKTVVVLVQENRSFDHMLGWFKTINPEIDGVTGSESNPISTSDPNSTQITFKDTAGYVDPDPDHSFQAIYEQVSGKTWDTSNPDPNPGIKMNGFVQNAERTTPGLSETVMNGFKPEAVPVFKQLVTEFAVCDRWFASLPASTQPNRLYVHSATSHGAMSNNTQQLIEGFPQKTIFESLEENGYSFGIYYQSFPSTLFYRKLRHLKYVDNFHQYDLSFKRHCKDGKLPNYVVIEPRYFDILTAAANDDHPSHDVSEGQKLVKEIYEALRSSPQWNEILFLVIYDEHGGFYDHVPTPTGVPSPDDIVGPEPYNFKFDRLGCRVPAIMVSPWIEPGTVLHRPSGPDPTSEFEHSSIAATLKKIFNLKEFLTKRDAWAGSFDIVVNRSTPRTDCPEKLAEPVKMRDSDAKETAKLSDFQEELVQAAAALKGDPFNLVENMTVSSGLKYVEDAFKKFYDDGQKAKEINEVEDTVSADASTRRTTASKTFMQKVFSCLVCDR